MYEPAPAKLNLFLHVTEKRADGYHNLESLIAFTDLCDTLEVQPSNTLSINVTGPFAHHTPTGEHNTVIKAARKILQALNTRKGARLILTKNLPVEAGIGGGSSDAAAALRLLVTFWNAPDNFKGTLLGIARSLGADVPVCLSNHTSRVSGIGDIITPASLPSGIAILLVNPGKLLPTPRVFRALTNIQPRHGRYNHPITDAHSLAALIHHTSNDLTATAIAQVPHIAQILSELQETPGCLATRMSGSGATCFGVFTDSHAAETAALQFTHQHPDFWVAATHLR